MKIIIVDKQTNINTIQKAIDQASLNDTIYIKDGIYYEKIKLTKNNIKLVGQSNNTIITYNDYAKKIHLDKKEYNTFRTYTFLILASNITLENLTIINDSGDGKVVGQAVALGIIGDNININNCILQANQDTLFLGPLPKDLIDRYENFLPKDELIFPKSNRHLITNSKIIGDVDFIFGSGNSYFIDCEIISNNKSGYITAPSTDISSIYGFTFLNCKFASLSLEPITYLSRPWRDYGKAVFINCLYQNHIYDVGFDKWNDTSRDKTARFYEYNCSYIDKHPYKRIYFGKQLSSIEATDYLNKLNKIFKKSE